MTSFRMAVLTWSAHFRYILNKFHDYLSIYFILYKAIMKYIVEKGPQERHNL